MEPGSLISNPLSAISLGLALMFGTAGLPHILMRFFTVKDAKAARKSVFYATGFIGYFYILTFIIGFGAIVLVSTDPAFLDAGILEKTKSGIAAIKGGSNMAAIHLANAVGGNIFLGFISAVAFATILAVVRAWRSPAPRRSAMTSTPSVIKKGKAIEQDEIRVSKIATLFLGVLAVILGIIFENQNVAFMVGLAFAIAASCNFPVLVMSIFWKGLTTRGALIGGFLGLISAVVGVVLSPAVWEATLGNPKGSAPFPYDNPALFSMPDRVRRHLAVLGSGPQRAGQGRRRRLRRAICALARPASARPAPPRTEAGPREGAMPRPAIVTAGPERQPDVAGDAVRLVQSLHGAVQSPRRASGSGQGMQMPKAFDATNPPFDRLDIARGRNAARRAGYRLLPPGRNRHRAECAAPTPCSWSSRARSRSATATNCWRCSVPRTVSTAAPSSTAGAVTHSWPVRRRSATSLPRTLTLGLIQSNPRFASFFYREISRKLDELARDEEERRYGSLMRARVAELFLHPPAFIDASDTIEAAGHLMREIDSNALFVRDGERIGIITGMNLSKAVVLRRQPIETPVRALAHFDVVTLRPDDFVSSALLLMTKRNKRRVAVHDGERYVGILEDIDLLGFLAGSAQVVAGRIDRASSKDDLMIAARETAAQVRTLRRQGVKVEVIGEVVSDLNGRLLSRLFEMVAPAEIRTSGCLIVMGSEGRGEQTVRTDQDNGLILAGPVDQAALDAFRSDFSGALADFGFPPCPGNVMVAQSGLVKAALRLSRGFPPLGGIA